MGEKVLGPCGRCPECLKKRASGWSFRLMQEEKRSISAYFVTLTYDPERVPITKNGFMGLDKKHLQLFFKRLRKAHTVNKAFNGKRLKYYAVGEYGGKSFRPHYHIILFNAELEMLVGKKEAGHVKRGALTLDGKTPFRCPSWLLGHITVGKVSEASVGYTLKYISKVSKIPMHKNDDRLREFPLMSKRLGDNYIISEYPYCEQWLHRDKKGNWSLRVYEKALRVLDKNSVNWHMADLTDRMYVNVPGGKKVGMPRYYKDKMYSEDQRRTIALAAQDKIQEKLSQQFDAASSVSLSTDRWNKEQSRHAAYRNQQINPNNKI